MESRKPEPTPVKPSITAPSVLAGFRRALLSGYKDLFSELDLTLATHFFKVAKAAYPHFTVNRFNLEVISLLPTQTQSNLFSKKVIAAYDNLILLRKLMIKQSIEKAIADGCEQVVFLGAGYDPRSIIAGIKHPQIQFFEIDRGPTRETKIAALPTMPIANDRTGELVIDTKENGTVVVNGNVHFINCDLAVTPLKDCLLENHFDPEKKSFVVAEGLLAYLTSDEVHQLVKQICDLCEHDDVIALLGYMDKFAYTPTIKKRQGDSNELWKSCLLPEDSIAFFADDTMEVVGQFEPASHLVLLEDFANQTYYETSDKEPREMYYLMKKGLSPERELNFGNIPKIPVTGQAPVIQECKPGCTLL